jgi:F420H(2)-dependent quinone reductase
MSNAATQPPNLPPPWFVHTAWRAHRALYRLSGGRPDQADEATSQRA